MPSFLSEQQVEIHAIEVLKGLDYTYLPGGDLSEGDAPERASLSEVVLVGRLKKAMLRLNPGIPEAQLDLAVKQVCQPPHPDLLRNNQWFHLLLRDGVTVESKLPDGSTTSRQVRLVDADQPLSNDWLAVNQFKVLDAKNYRIPDVLLFVNGLPLVVIELKKPGKEDISTRDAFNQLQAYKELIPALMLYNEVLIASDGTSNRVGSLTASFDRFLPWRAKGDGENDVVPVSKAGIEVVLSGLCKPEHLLDYCLHLTTYENDDGKLTKKQVAYHQFQAVRKCAEAAKRACGPGGDKRCGVVWHTQGSGKSLTMLFTAAKMGQTAALANPTIVVLTDRNDLDGQLYGVFAKGEMLLRQPPLQASSREKLRELLESRPHGGIIFATIQKFSLTESEIASGQHPILSDRSNIIVMADEAHRSQYGFKGKVSDKGQLGFGFAKYCRDALPNASFLGFTGTPIDSTDKSTRTVFGDYIKPVYDILRAIEDKCTVPILYESRLVKLHLNDSTAAELDEVVDELAEGESDAGKEHLKSRWAQVEAVVGAQSRVDSVAKDIVAHFHKREMFSGGGKAMIVCMSRNIAMAMHDAIAKLKPEWVADDDAQGQMKVIMTGDSSEGDRVAKHSRSKARREDLAKRFKDPKDNLKLVIVRDMWLTGFDCPPMHTLYVDKPMQGHNLMQAIARVNRVYGSKPSGLVVDYIGLASYLQEAVKTYSDAGAPADLAEDIHVAAKFALMKLEVVRDLFHGFPYQQALHGSAEVRLDAITNGTEHILAQDKGKEVFLKEAALLAKAFAMAGTDDALAEHMREVAYFQAVRGTIAKNATGTSGSYSGQDLELMMGQLVSQAVAADGVQDIFNSLGAKKTDISILSEQFLGEIQQIPQKNLAAAALHKLLSEQIRTALRGNLVKQRSFRQMLEEAINKYTNKALSAHEVIEELLKIAKFVKETRAEGQELGLNEQDELCFYHALCENEQAVREMKAGQLTEIAKDLADKIRKNAALDWTKKDAVRAKLRMLIRLTLKKHGYPPDAPGTNEYEKATLFIIKQAEELAKVSSGEAL